MARPEKCRCICSLPEFNSFSPDSKSTGTITVSLDEYEVFRLLNLEKKTQAECAFRMRVSRPTVARISSRVSEKLALALVKGKRIVIDGGDVFFCPGLRPECADEPNCCHKIINKTEKEK